MLDFLIIGQGIAGTLFAHELEKRGKRFMLVDAGQTNASLTAAGMVNPVILKRFSPVWQGRIQIERARQTMAELSQKLDVKLDYPFDILRIFHNSSEKQTWLKKAKTPQLSGLLDEQFDTSPSDNMLAPHGVGRIHWGGRIDLTALLSTYRLHLESHGCLREERFDYEQLSVGAFCAYDDIQAKYVVFCEGYGLKHNPYFNHLPLNGNKGEVLIARIPHLVLSACVKSSVFIMPLPEQGDDVYFIGATYNWNDKDSIPTEAGKTELLTKLSNILPNNVFQSVEILEHRAGMRPTVADRRPLLGRHETYHKMFVFNGLGTRGVMLGATMARLLCAHILDGDDLPNEVDIRRFVEKQ